MAAYIFLCDLSTEQECLDRSLVGTNIGKAYEQHLRHVAVGDRVFLYNLETGMLRGPFTATTACEFKLEPDAWKRTRRSFPWQVRVDASKAFAKPISVDDFAPYVPLTSTSVGVMPASELSDEQVQKLVADLQRVND